MSGDRPTFRYGLPFRWWLSKGLWQFIGVVLALAAIISILALYVVYLLAGWAR